MSIDQIPSLNAVDLINARRDIPVPFLFKLKRADNTEVTLRIEEVYRLLPGRRVVALADDAGSQVLVKIFLGRSAGKYASRERHGVSAIVESGVRTAALKWNVQLPDATILGFEFLPEAKSLFDQWNQDEQTQNDILKRVMKILARLHNNGVIQSDIHLENFLLSGGKIHTIDGGGIERKSAGPLPETASLRNLALFFAQLYPRFDKMVDHVFGDYESLREWYPDAMRVDRFHDEIQKSREARKRTYIGKAFRECSRFVCNNSFNRFVVCERSDYSDEIRNLLDDPDAAIESGEILKQGNSATVALIKQSDRRLVIKRYNIKNPVHGIRRAFRKSRAWCSWRNAFHMEFLGIPSLKPVALIENRFGPIRTTAYLVTEYLEGPDALRGLKDLSEPNGELEAIAGILDELSNAKLSHGDLKATNFLMTPNGPVIIDLDGMEEYEDAGRFARAFGRDLERFMANWQDEPELRQRFSNLLADLTVRYGANV